MVTATTTTGTSRLGSQDPGLQSPAERQGSGGPSGLQNRQACAAHRLEGSIPSPLRNGLLKATVPRSGARERIVHGPEGLDPDDEAITNREQLREAICNWHIAAVRQGRSG